MLHIDLSLFDHHYDGLASLELDDVFTDQNGQTVYPIINRNLTDGRAQGLETLVTFTPSDWRQLSASYSYLHLSLDASGQDLNRGKFYEGATPRHQFALGSYLTLPGGFELDTHFRSLSAIHTLPEIVTGDGIPGYSELDVQLSWRASPAVRISVVGQNLLDDHHVEFGTPAARGAIERGVYGKIVWDF